MLPLTGAVWSSSPTTARAYPARYLIRFFANHGMLTVTNSPQWKTVVGGSRVYVEAVANRLDRVLVSTPVERVERTRDGVVVNGERRHDRVVIAAHPDQALAMLADASEAERRVLGAWTYSQNHTVLHTDGSLLPHAHGARASWNYLLDTCSTSQPNVHVTYHLNRLQALIEPLDYCVTLNQTSRIEPEPGAAPDGLRAPRLHACEPRGAGRPAGDPGRSRHRTTAAPTTAGGSTRTAASRASARPLRWGAPGEVVPVRGPGGARPPDAGSQRLSLRRLHVARRPRRAGGARHAACGRSAPTGGRSRRSAAATTSATPHRSIRENVDAYLANARHRPRGRRRAAAHQRARARLRLQPALGVLLPRPRRRAALRRRRGAQHVRRAALLPAAAGRARPRRDRQGVLRLAVPHGRRPLPDVVRAARRPARRSR